MWTVSSISQPPLPFILPSACINISELYFAVCLFLEFLPLGFTLWKRFQYLTKFLYTLTSSKMVKMKIVHNFKNDLKKYVKYLSCNKKLTWLTSFPHLLVMPLKITLIQSPEIFLEKEYQILTHLTCDIQAQNLSRCAFYLFNSPFSSPGNPSPLSLLSMENRSDNYYT